jgi:3-polyprenyl-4-hydroxybenzoate decarboxylase
MAAKAPSLDEARRSGLDRKESMADLLRRLAGARVLRARDALTLVHEDGSASRLEGDSAALCEAVLEFFDAPRSRDDVLWRVRALAEEPFDERVIDELLALLCRAGALGPAGAGSGGEAATRTAPAIGGARADAAAPGLRVVLGVTGAIQAVEAPRLVGLLQRRGFEVRVAATRAARRFVSLDALAALTHCPVATGLWGRAGEPAAHIALAAWADLMVVYPASATTLSRLARGDFSDVVSAAALATRAPVLLAPSMNEGMLRAPAVERNLAVLRDDGFLIAEPSWGIEVADPPAARAPQRGAALSPERVIDLIAVAATQHAPRTGTLDRAGTTDRAGIIERAAAEGELASSRDRIDWDDVYADESAPLPWATAELPPDLAAELAELPPPRSLLDIGTGLGTAAIHAAGRGYRVVATDVSRAGLLRARRLAGDLPITFVRDDITDTRLRRPVRRGRGSRHVPHPRRAPGSRLRRGARLAPAPRSDAAPRVRRRGRRPPPHAPPLPRRALGAPPGLRAGKSHAHYPRNERAGRRVAHRLEPHEIALLRRAPPSAHHRDPSFAGGDRTTTTARRSRSGRSPACRGRRRSRDRGPARRGSRGAGRGRDRGESGPGRARPRPGKGRCRA